MENKKFFIRVESNEKIGTGHLMRCLTIANSLRKMGNQVHFISKNMSKESKELLESNKFSVNLLDYKRKKFDYEIDAKFTIEIIKKERKNSTFLIIDNYEIDKKWETLVKKFVKKIIVIDDLANRKHSCELLIDQNLNSDIKEKQYKKLTPKNCILLTGTQFAILRPEFYKLRKLTKTRTKIKNILISYGGTDPTNETIKVLKALKNLGAQIIKRPKQLADDTAPLEPVIQHVLDNLKRKENYSPDIIVLLQNTSPLRNSKYIDGVVSVLTKGKYDSVLSGYPYHTFVWNVEKNSSITPSSYDPQNRKRRQESNEQVLENGAIYATTRKAFKKSQCRISGKIGFYPMPMELSYNIDNEDDLHNAERILQNQKIYVLFSVKGKNIIITGIVEIIKTPLITFVKFNE